MDSAAGPNLVFQPTNLLKPFRPAPQKSVCKSRIRGPFKELHSENANVIRVVHEELSPMLGIGSFDLGSCFG